MSRLVFFCIVLLVCFGSNRGQENCSASNQTLEFLYITSFGEALNSSGSVLGMMMALDRINANSSVLPDYQLRYSAIVDSQCERSTSLSRFLDSVNDPCRNFVAVIGSGCSVATKPVAEIGYFWGLSHIAYVSSDGGFKDTALFRKYLQISPSEDNFGPAIVSGVLSFGWSQVGIITQRESLFTTSHDLVTQLLNDNGVKVLSSPLLDTADDPANVPDLFPENGRIFFLNTYEDKARQVICEAYRRGMYGKYYVWLVFGWYDREWWREEDTVFPDRCTADQLYKVLDRSFAIQQYPINSDRDKKAVGNLSYNEFLEEYNQRVRDSPYRDSYTSHLAYDATWTLAFALDKVVERLEREDLGNCSDLPVKDSLQDWSYARNATASCLVYEALQETRFEGVSGEVVFDENGIRFPIQIRLSQYREGQLELFALVEGSNTILLSGESTATLFPDGIPPDGTPIVTITTFHPALVAIVYFLALVGLVFAGVCFLFIFLNRKKDVVKLSTNVLNYCMVLGVVIVFVSLFFRVCHTTDQTTVTVFCYLSLWFGNIGYAVTFSAILTKMFRTYYVFFYPSKQKISLNNWHLLSIVATLTSVMVAIIFVGSVIPSTRPSAFLSDDTEFPPTTDERGVLQMFMYYRCYPRDSALWFAVIFLFLAVMDIAALVLVFQIKSIKVKVLNDSKAVTGIVFVTSVFLVVLVIVTFTFTGYQNGSEALFSGSLIVVAYSVLILMFVPKMVHLYKDPNGENLLRHPRNRSTINLNKRGVLIVVRDEERIESLSKEVEELETAIEAKKASLKAIDSAVPIGSLNQSGISRPLNNDGKCLEISNGTSSVYLDVPDHTNDDLENSNGTVI